MLSDKPVEAFGGVLAPLAAKFYAASLPPPRGIAGAELALRLAGSGVPTAAFDSVARALPMARSEAGEGPVVVCGSFLTVAAAAEQLHG